MIKPGEMEAVERVLNDIRKEFPIKEAFTYEEKHRKLIAEEIWDLCAILEKDYNAEADYVVDEMSRYHEVRKDEDEQ